MKTFCIGDIHGNLHGLKQTLGRSKFDYENDLLITLGDIVDGHIHSFECVLELLKIKNRIDLRGNHDQIIHNWLLGKGHSFQWNQGGINTAQSFANVHGVKLEYDTHYELDMFGKMQPKHDVNLQPVICRPEIFSFFNKQVKCYVDQENRAFVHAGYIHPDGLGNDTEEIYYWSRDLWTKHAMMTHSQNIPKLLRPHKEIFIGHTTTENWNTYEPMNCWNVWNLDTGAGYTGKVTIMNIDTHEYWQSDKADELYNDIV